jgi:hypothetical protein
MTDNRETIANARKESETMAAQASKDFALELYGDVYDPRSDRFLEIVGIVELARMHFSSANNAQIASLQEANARLTEQVRVLREACQEVERHHIKLNSSKGRSEERSHTLSIIRAALASIEGGTQA